MWYLFSRLMLKIKMHMTAAYLCEVFKIDFYGCRRLVATSSVNFQIYSHEYF